MRSESPTIHDHAAIGDGRSVALIARDGTVDWLCWPTFDAPAIFASLLDPDRGGSWRIAPRGDVRVTRAYVRDTNVLETLFEQVGGAAIVTDAMTVPESSQLGSNHELVRRVRCTRGSIEMELAFAPRPYYGMRPCRLQATRNLGVRCEVGAWLFALHGDRSIDVRGDTAVARFTLRAGETAAFALTFDDEIASLPLLGEHADARIERTIGWWQQWTARLTYHGPYRDHVARSLLAMKLLAFAPSGAMVAAPTTSLPERVGGEHNWDYRFCWLRDASFTARAFYELGYREEATAFCGWLLHATRLTLPELRILYDVYGRPPAKEQVLALSGYRDSRPVRIFNAASDQLQLDCYGEVVDAATWSSREHGLDRETQSMLVELGNFVLARWQRPDQGIWEYRDEPKRRTHSTVLAWVALDRLLRLHRGGAVQRLDADRLARACAAIHDDVYKLGWNETLGSYTEEFGANEVDASTLLLPYYGFEDARSPRMLATYRHVEGKLRAGDGLYWRNERGKRLGEGAFGICTAWVVDFLVRAGEHGRAHQVLDRFLTCANDVGLFAEEVDPMSREALGNFPQAYTHLGVITAALALESAAHESARQGGAA